MYRSPPRVYQCPNCAAFASNVRGINEAFILIEEARGKWADVDSLMNQSVLVVIEELLLMMKDFAGLFLYFDDMF